MNVCTSDDSVRTNNIDDPIENYTATAANYGR